MKQLIHGGNISCYIVDMSKFKCKYCGQLFSRTKSEIRRGRTKFCGRECSNRGRVKRDIGSGYRWCHYCKRKLAVNEFYRPNSNYCRPCEREKATNWYRANRDKALLQRKLAHIKRKYSLTAQEYYALLQAGCAICGGFNRLVVDHSHATGKTRGVLCNGCNAGLGYFLDNPISLQNAIKYLG